MAEMRRLALVSALVATLAVAAAPASKPLVLRAEQDLEGQLSQQAVVFGEDAVTVSRNSNFLCEPASSTKLGAFKARYDDHFESARLQAEQAAARLGAPDEARVEPGRGPHALKLFVGKTNVAGLRPTEGTIRRVLESACEDEGLKPERAVLVTLAREKGKLVLRSKTLGGKEAGRTSTLSASKACKERANRVWECSVRGYGRAFLKVSDGS